MNILFQKFYIQYNRFEAKFYLPPVLYKIKFVGKCVGLKVCENIRLFHNISVFCLHVDIIDEV